MKSRIPILLFAANILGCQEEAATRNVAKLEESVLKTVGMEGIDSGYHSSANDWVSFLQCWREASQMKTAGHASRADKVNFFPVTSVASVYYQRNTNLLVERERQLAMQLPLSYRHFVQITGGNWFVESARDYELLPKSHFVQISNVDLFQKSDHEGWKIWHSAFAGLKETIPPDQYYRYGYSTDPKLRQDDSQFRWGDGNQFVKVAELERGTVLLLNKAEVTSDGEWESWMLSTQFGAARYRSFAELMQYVLYQDLYDVSYPFLSVDKLNKTCAAHLRTAATSK